jgi:hypothetical protein
VDGRGAGRDAEARDPRPDGSIRDLKEQTFALLPARHLDDRGVAYLEVAAEQRAMAHEQPRS